MPRGRRRWVREQTPHPEAGVLRGRRACRVLAAGPPPVRRPVDHRRPRGSPRRPAEAHPRPGAPLRRLRRRRAPLGALTRRLHRPLRGRRTPVRGHPDVVEAPEPSRQRGCEHHTCTRGARCKHHTSTRGASPFLSWVLSWEWGLVFGQWRERRALSLHAERLVPRCTRRRLRGVVVSLRTCRDQEGASRRPVPLVAGERGDCRPALDGGAFVSRLLLVNQHDLHARHHLPGEACEGQVPDLAGVGSRRTARLHGRQRSRTPERRTRCRRADLRPERRQTCQRTSRAETP